MLRLIIASVVWAFSFGLIKHKLVMAGLDPFLIAFARLGISLLVFLPFLRVRRIDERTTRTLLGLGVIQYGVMYVAYLYSYRFLAAHEVALLTIFTPIFVAAIHDSTARCFHKVFMVSALLAVVGAGVIVWSGGAVQSKLTGFLLLQIANFAFAFGQVRYRSVMRRLEGVQDHQVFALLYLGGALFAMLPFLFSSGWQAVSVSPQQSLTLLYLGVVPSGLCFYLWNSGARKTNAGTLGVLNNAKIPLAVAVSLVVFRESTDLARLLIGGSVILAAAALAQWHARHE